MASIPEVAQIESEEERLVLLEGERSLDIILNEYNVENITRLTRSKFRDRYLPLLARADLNEADASAVRRMWIEEVATSSRKPVFIVDDSTDEVIYRVPPFIGTSKTSVTGHKNSFAAMASFEERNAARLSSSGEKIRKVRYEAMGCLINDNRGWQLTWIKILYDFGYHTELLKTLGKGPYPDDIKQIVGENFGEEAPLSKNVVTDGGSSFDSVVTVLDDELYADE